MTHNIAVCFMPWPRRPYQTAKFKKEAKSRAVLPCILLMPALCLPSLWSLASSTFIRIAPLRHLCLWIRLFYRAIAAKSSSLALYPKTSCQWEDSKANTSIVLSFLFSWTGREVFRWEEGRNILEKKKLSAEAGMERKAVWVLLHNE